MTAILFFSIVVAVWLGMNNTVWELRRKRRQFAQDSMAGLQADACLVAKIAFFQVLAYYSFASCCAWCGRGAVRRLRSTWLRTWVG